VKGKDKFDNLRFLINQKLKEADTFLLEKEKLEKSNDPKVIYNRKLYEKKTEELLNDVDVRLKEIEIELKSQKKNPKKMII
jgi:hypothetical protein